MRRAVPAGDPLYRLRQGLAQTERTDVAGAESLSPQVPADAGVKSRGHGWLAGAGLLTLAVAVGLYAVNLAVHPLHLLVSDADLAVYRNAGLVARRSPGQLYSWQQSPGVRFTYTPFAAVLCGLASALPWVLAAWLMLAGSAVALLQSVWLTMGALG